MQIDTKNIPQQTNIPRSPLPSNPNPPTPPSQQTKMRDVNDGSVKEDHQMRKTGFFKEDHQMTQLEMPLKNTLLWVSYNLHA